MSEVLGNFGKENICPLANGPYFFFKHGKFNRHNLKLIVCTYLLSRLGDYSTETDSSQRY